MSRLCKWFGHKPVPWYGGVLPTISAPYLDGIRRAHRDLHLKCERCGEQYWIGKVIDSYVHPDTEDMNLLETMRAPVAVDQSYHSPFGEHVANEWRFEGTQPTLRGALHEHRLRLKYPPKESQL